MAEVKMSFLGGAKGVGRSSIELSNENGSIILDSGVNLGGKGEDRYPIDPKGKISALALTHAHLDHSGYVPAILSKWDCDLFATSPTVDISEILLRDYLSLIPDNEAKPYDASEIYLLRRKEKSIRFGLATEPIEGWELIPFNAGHVLGSAMIYLRSPDGTSILYTGDLNTTNTRTLRGANMNIPEVDYLIIESTYGGDEDIHPSRKKVERKFVEDIKKVLELGGVVIVPAFALGRSQEVLLTLVHYIESGFLQEVPIFIDGMIREVSKFYSMYWSWLRPELQRRIRESKRGLFDHRTIEEVRNRDELLELSEPFIIITTSGMLQGGPVLTYLKHYGIKKGNLIYLTGYQVRGTRGRLLLDGARDLQLPDGSSIHIEADVQFADFSAHADQPNLINFISKLWEKGLKEVELVHGEPGKMIQLRRKLERRGIRTYIPELGESIILS